MSAFWVSAVFGVFETLLLFAVGLLFLKRKRIFAFALLIAKIVTYYFAVKKLLAVYYGYMIYCVFGALSGFAVTTVFSFVVLLGIWIFLKKRKKNM